MKKTIKVLFVTIVALVTVSLSAVFVEAAQTLSVENALQVHMDPALLKLNNSDNYTFTASETQYYRFYLDNQSISVKEAGDLVNTFVRLEMAIYDCNDKLLGSAWAKNGYKCSMAFKLEKDQTYKIKVYVNSFLGVSQNFAFGNYNLSVKKLQDIGADTWDAAPETEISTSVASAIDVGGDYDWFKFYTNSEPAYFKVCLENIQADTLYFYLYEYVKGAGETPLRKIDDFSVSNGRVSTYVYNLNYNSTYYYRLSSSGTGGYLLQTSRIEDIGGNSINDAEEITLGEKYKFSFDAGKDKDFVKFTTSNKTSYYRVYLANITYSGKSYAYLYDSNKKEIKNGYSGDYPLGSISLSPNTTYYLMFYADSSGTGEYEFSVEEFTDTYPNNIKDAVAVELNKTYKTSFDGAKDSDYIKFTTGEQRAYYQINLEKKTFSADADVYLFDSDGEKIAGSSTYRSYQHYDSVSFSYQLSSNTTYYVEFCGSGTGTYEFSVKQFVDTYPDTKEEAAAIQIDKTYNTSFDGANDKDFIKFTTGYEKTYYRINLKKKTFSADADVYLFNSDGEKIAGSSTYRSYQHYDSVSFSYQLSSNTTYYVEFCGSGTGTYEFSIEKLKDEDSDSQQNATPIYFNQKYQRELCIDSDVDYFVLKNVPDGTYPSFTVNNESCSSLYFKVISTRDVVVASNGGYSKGNYSKSVKLEGGDYYICVYGKAGYYTLNITKCGGGHVSEITLYGKVATCTEAGLTDGKKCLDCGTITLEQKEIKALGHDFKDGFCTRCNTRDANYDPCAKGHVREVNMSAVKPTCTETGLTEGKKCLQCGKVTVEQKVVPATGHKFQDGKCTVCGISQTCQNGHTSLWIEPQEPTCQETGHTGYYKCAVCGIYLSDTIIKNKVDHKYYDGVCIYCGQIDPSLKPQKFDDVGFDAWYKNAVDYVTVKGLFNGTTETLFDPNSSMTRAMLVTVLWRCAGKPATTDKNQFIDVPDDEWYTVAIIWAADNGIVNGVGDSEFDPDGEITREEMATILYRYANNIDVDTETSSDLSDYPDGRYVSDWAIAGLEWAIANGYINGTDKQGYSSLVIDHDGLATRAQVATVFMRFMSKIAKQTD